MDNVILVECIDPGEAIHLILEKKRNAKESNALKLLSHSHTKLSMILNLSLNGHLSCN